jgi:hypothetical protein
LRIDYDGWRRVVTLEGIISLKLHIRRCQNPICKRHHVPVHPEEEGRFALPHGEFGLDVIALVGRLRFREHRSVPEIHQHLRGRGVPISERSVTTLVERYEELVALFVGQRSELNQRLRAQGKVVLAIDGLQPDVGHELLWVARDCLSGEVLGAQCSLSATEADLTLFLREVVEGLPVPVAAVVSDGQLSLRRAVAAALPGVPHQLCQYHYLREAAKPIYEADRHAKKVLKTRVRGVRPLERAVEGRTDDEAEAVRGYCLAVRSAITDDGHPPLNADGIRLHDRLEAIRESLERVAEKGGTSPY